MTCEKAQKGNENQRPVLIYIKRYIVEYSHQYFENKDCKYYPCHQGLEACNCLFCYCPMYNYEDCLGKPSYKEKDGKKLKVCTNCSFPHEAKHYEDIMEFLRQNRYR